MGSVTEGEVVFLEAPVVGRPVRFVRGGQVFSSPPITWVQAHPSDPTRFRTRAGNSAIVLGRVDANALNATNSQPSAPPSMPAIIISNQPAVIGAGTALVLGILSLFTWLLPIVGLPISILGIVYGARAVSGPEKAAAIIAIGLSIIGLILTIISAFVGLLVGALFA